MTRRFVCIVCPNGCELTAHLENGAITGIEGGLCKRGVTYAQNEILHPVRTIATSVQVYNGELPLTSVRLDAPIEKAEVFKLMDAIKEIRLPAPVHIGQIVLKNALGTEANVIVTKNVKAITRGDRAK